MQKQNFKNSIVSFVLIVSTILMPFSLLPREAEAQYNIAGYTRGLAPAIARLPQCQEEIGSGIKKLFSGIGNLFSGETGGDDDTAIPDGPSSSAGGGVNGTKVDNLEAKTESATWKATLPVTNSPAANKLQEEANTILKNIDKETQNINKNSTCIQSIGRLITKMLLQKLTLSTVNWINSGFDGSPSFIQNPGKFFGDIAENEILQFGIEIQNSPFGKEWLRNQALAYKTKFAENARYSLDELIQQTNPDYSAETFQTDFSLGGWDAWTAMTQVPANNPLGAKLMFDNEIQKRLAGTSQSTAEQVHEALSQANGFLGDQRCINAETGRIDYDTTWSEAEAALKETPQRKICSRWEYVTPGKMVADAATNVMGYQNNSLLNVQDLNDAVAAVSDAILNQFSTSIYEKGFANLDYQGIDGVLVFNNSNSDFRTQTEKDYIPSQLSSSWLQANPEFNIRTDLTQALIDEQRTYSDKLALQNKELMSTTDGKDYSIAVCPDGWTGTYPNCKGPTITGSSTLVARLFGGITVPNGTCPSDWTGTYPDCKGPENIKKGESNAYGLIPVIYQLDYCIPGPHPGWENDSRETLRKIVLPQEPNSSNEAGQIANDIIGTGISVGASFIPVVGPFVGPVLGSLFGAISSDSEAKAQSTNIRGFYTNQFNSLTGYQAQAVYGNPQDQTSNNMATSDGFSYAINGVLDRYIKIINKTYFSSPDILPPITKESEKEFNQLSGYIQIIDDNKDKMLEIKTTVNILGEIKDKVDKLNTQLEDGYDENGNVFTEEQYEEALKFQINAFGRLSAGMVNGDDIANANDLAQQIVLKKDYIYKNLLKGPYGCEAFLENQANIKQFPSAGSGVKQSDYDWNKYNINSIKRMTYPFPIIYDYNILAKGDSIPDPWTNCSVINPPKSCNNKMPTKDSYDKYDKYSPGFLNFVHFSAIYDCGGGKAKPGEICDNSPRTNTYNGSERLSLSGLINDFAPGYQDERRDFSNVSVGEFGPWGGGPFEKTIGVY